MFSLFADFPIRNFFSMERIKLRGKRSCLVSFELVSPNSANSLILTLEILHKKPHWKCFPSFWSYAHCLHHHPPQSHPGFVGNFGCSWAVVKSYDPDPGPPEEQGVTE